MSVLSQHQQQLQIALKLFFTLVQLCPLCTWMCFWQSDLPPVVLPVSYPTCILVPVSFVMMLDTKCQSLCYQLQVSTVPLLITFTTVHE